MSNPTGIADVRALIDTMIPAFEKNLSQPAFAPVLFLLGLPGQPMIPVAMTGDAAATEQKMYETANQFAARFNAPAAMLAFSASVRTAAGGPKQDALVLFLLEHGAAERWVYLVVATPDGARLRRPPIELSEASPPLPYFHAPR